MQTSADRGSGEASTRRTSDPELISRFLAGRDESAFAELVTRYSRLVMSVALHTLRDPHAAEDAFQATFLVLARSARRIRNRDSLASWLHGTTFRVSRRLLRSRLRRKEQDLPSVELPAPVWATPTRPDEQAALDEELARLSEGLRGPLVLHYLEGRTVPEIAAELKMSQSAVEGRLKRGRKTLRKRLLKRGVLLSSAAFGAGFTVPVGAGVAGSLVTRTVATCLATAAGKSLTPIAASTIQQIALQEMAAMSRIAILKAALVCGGVAGAIGLAGAGANGTLGTAWAQRSGEGVVSPASEPQLDSTEASTAPTGLIHTAIAQAPAGSPNVVLETEQGVLTASALQIGGAGGEASAKDNVPDEFRARPAPGGQGTAIELSVSEAMKIASQQAAAKDQQIRALEQMVQALQVQIDQLRQEAARGNQRPAADPPGRGRGQTNAPQSPATGSGFGGMGMGSASGFGGMELSISRVGGSEEVVEVQTTRPPTRPKAVEVLLKSADESSAKALRDYLGQLETSSGPPAVKSEPRVVQTFQSESENDSRIRNALDAPAELQLTGQTLQEVMNYIAQEYGITIRLDTKALTKAKIGPDNEINLVVKDLSLRSALALLLEDVNGVALDYLIEDEVMKVTTREVADAKIQTVIYDASSLGPIYGPSLMDIIQQTVEPESWFQSGGKGTIVPLGNSVVITTTRRLHDKVAEIMRMLENHAKSTKASR